MITVAILTISDSAFGGTREDISGPALKTRCEELSWSVVETQIVPDEISAIAELVTRWVDEQDVSVVLTTGGTGVTTRDVTPEATRTVIDREIPGFGELMRSKGIEQTPLAPLSRALAGSRGQSLIVNLPGSPKGALYSLNAVVALIPHAVRLLHGRTQH